MRVPPVSGQKFDRRLVLMKSVQADLDSDRGNDCEQANAAFARLHYFGMVTGVNVICACASLDPLSCTVNACVAGKS